MNYGFLSLNPISKVTSQKLVTDDQVNYFWEEIIRTPTTKKEVEDSLSQQQTTLDKTIQELTARKQELVGEAASLSITLNQVNS